MKEEIVCIKQKWEFTKQKQAVASKKKSSYLKNVLNCKGKSIY